MIALLFGQPEFLPLLLTAPLLLLYLRVMRKRAAARLSRSIGPRLASRQSRPRGDGEIVAATLLLALAASAPSIGTEVREREQGGLEILLCLDVSQSMLAEDLPKSRLDYAKREIASFVRAYPRDRIGLIAFAGDARLLVPKTEDHESFLRLLSRAGPLSVKRGSTDLGAALQQARQSLGEDERKATSIILLTDGEDHQGSGRAVAAQCQAEGLDVHVVGLGSRLGAKIRVGGPASSRFLKDRSGQDVVTRLHQRDLSELAAMGGGSFVIASDSSGALRRIRRKLARASREEGAADATRRVPKDRAAWFLALGLLAYLLSCYRFWRGRS